MAIGLITTSPQSSVELESSSSHTYRPGIFVKSKSDGTYTLETTANNHLPPTVVIASETSNVGFAVGSNLYSAGDAYSLGSQMTVYNPAPGTQMSVAISPLPSANIAAGTGLTYNTDGGLRAATSTERAICVLVEAYTANANLVLHKVRF